MEQLQAIVSSLNPLATVVACEQAKVGGGGPGRGRGQGVWGLAKPVPLLSTLEGAQEVAAYVIDCVSGKVLPASAALLPHQHIPCSTNTFSPHLTHSCIACPHPPPPLPRSPLTRCLAAMCTRWLLTSTLRVSTGGRWQQQRRHRRSTTSHHAGQPGGHRQQGRVL